MPALVLSVRSSRAKLFDLSFIGELSTIKKRFGFKGAVRQRKQSVLFSPASTAKTDS
jgi:hypothetical protein